MIIFGLEENLPIKKDKLQFSTVMRAKNENTLNLQTVQGWDIEMHIRKQIRSIEEYLAVAMAYEMFVNPPFNRFPVSSTPKFFDYAPGRPRVKEAHLFVRIFASFFMTSASAAAAVLLRAR